jgi:hypothetical protein
MKHKIKRWVPELMLNYSPSGNIQKSYFPSFQCIANYSVHTSEEEDAASTEATALTSVMMDRKEETFVGSTEWPVCKRVYG